MGMTKGQKFWLYVSLVLGMFFPPLLIFVGLLLVGQYIADAIKEDKDVYLHVPDDWYIQSEEQELTLKPTIRERLARMMDRSR